MQNLSRTSIIATVIVAIAAIAAVVLFHKSMPPIEQQFEQETDQLTSDLQLLDELAINEYSLDDLLPEVQPTFEEDETYGGLLPLVDDLDESEEYVYLNHELDQLDSLVQLLEEQELQSAAFDAKLQAILSTQPVLESSTTEPKTDDTLAGPTDATATGTVTTSDTQPQPTTASGESATFSDEPVNQ